MNLFNKLFGGSPPDTEASKHLPLHPLSELPHDMNLVPLDGLAAGEHHSAAQFSSQPPQAPQTSTHTVLQEELAYLEKYDRLQDRMDTSELYEIFYTLETISDAISDINRSNAASDEFMENWKPILNHIEHFTTKKKLLESIEAQMVQTIRELRDIHQKMFDSLDLIKHYNSEREAVYAARKKLADDLERKLRLLQDHDHNA
jgi:DNA repair ATPase RecN